VALWATALNLLLGVGIATAMARLALRRPRVLDAVSRCDGDAAHVLGYYLLVLIGSQGPIGAWLAAPFGIRLIFPGRAPSLPRWWCLSPLCSRARGRNSKPSRATRGCCAHLGHPRDRGVLFVFRCRSPGEAFWPGCCLSFARALGEFAPR